MASGLNDSAKIKSYKFVIPFVGEIEWEPDPSQRRAAWELYVELATRVAVQSIDLDVGSSREALNSLYSLFATTRDVLRRAGPEVGARKDTVGGVAIAVLNVGLRPFLSRWHPALNAYEVQRPPAMLPKNWEQAWSEDPTMRGELEALRRKLAQYAATLAEMAGVQIL